MIRQTEIDFPNITINNVGIVTNTGKNFEIFPRTNFAMDESFLLDQITITEDMFSEAIFGSISFFDSTYITDQLNLNSTHDNVYFTFNGKAYSYRVLDINVSSDLASKQVSGPIGTVNKVTIRFSSESFVNKNFDTLFDSNYIGKISKDAKSKPSTILPAGFDSAEFKKHEASMSGFVQDMMAKFAPNAKLEADSTYNDIWLKTENFFYPLFKIGNNLRISQLMNYVCEYACFIDNPKAVNFFFWEDLDKWNFKCVESLIKDKTNFKGTYNLAGDRGQSENYQDTIVAMEVISDTALIKLYDSGAAFSEYIRVVPNWGNAWRGFMDNSIGLSGATAVSGSVVQEQITYNYKTDGNKWLKIASNAPFNKQSLSDIVSKQDYGTVRISDLNYGFYSNANNAKNVPWWNHYDFSSSHGYLGDKLALSKNKGGYDILNKQDLFDKHPGSRQVSRIETEYWQAQYDFSELPGAFLRTIYKDIKWELTKARTKYADAKKLKMQWSVYRNTICCDQSTLSGSFFAVLTKAVSVTDGKPSGVYRYEWKQVELWPRLEVDKITDTSYEIIEAEGNISFWFVFISSPKHAKGKSAYNLNELLNSYIPSKLENGNQTLTIGPGISVPANTLSYEDRQQTTSYPKHFKMMPVGENLIAIKNNCSPDQTYYGGRIVQMQAVSSDVMQNIKGFTAGIHKQNSNVYLFDVVNAHDGICGKCSGD
jgi:hypothetical protein